MRFLGIALMAAGALGVVATFVLAASGDTTGAGRTAGAASSAFILGLVLYRR
ncbi:hypothetical protein [Roseomonas sp. KE2513]|uniref:hypothetical protein n=1 Tax=Roseomonas sp. KE2513 TaxID=2479202 RepID=UPI0018DF1D91|nr:hypothetical protein [Roseomonas sp. KE2513]